MAVDDLLSDEGFLYASTPPVEEGDPGRFHALFGRDSLIAALQLLPARPEVAHGTLRALAARQGRRSHPGTLEEPGRIGHEFRDAAPEPFLEAGWPDDGRVRLLRHRRRDVVVHRARDRGRRVRGRRRGRRATGSRGRSTAAAGWCATDPARGRR